MNANHHRGSALLVVLGMIAFMVVSAVAFSAYMRYSRLPSSFLRQTTSARLLVKAALANAIDEIDSAIGNNPHPGVGTASTAYPRGNGSSWQRNIWVGRVYMGTNSASAVSASQTVTPLCLEALAYLPPPLVNEVRYYSRRSPAATWHRMNFDAGRYAFCAVDVSDYFDVNALEAGGPRSSDPESKISLAYLFENPDHTSSGGGSLGAPSTWDSFMDAYRGDTKVPLISLADWNLAFSKNGGPFVTPFCNYVENNPDNFYNLTGTIGAEADAIRQQTFVTDSYFPPEVAAGDMAVYDLSDDQFQPWTVGQLQQRNPNAYETIMSGESVGLQRLKEFMPYVARAALYDYLDEDRVPISLALPTTERVPMVCAIEMAYNGTLAVKAQDPQYEYEPEERPQTPRRIVHKTIQYNLDRIFSGPVGVKALVTYPFRHRDELSASSFSYDGALMFFLTSGEMGLRPTRALDRLKALDSEIFTSASVRDGVITLPLRASANASFDGDIDSEANAVKTVNFITQPGSVSAELLAEAQALLKAKLKLEQTAQPIDPNDLSRGYDWNNPTPANDKIEDPASNAEVEEAVCNFRPLNVDGQTDPSFTRTGSELFIPFRDNASGLELRLNVAVVIRVKLNDKVVDMVPACGAHDQFNGSSNWNGAPRTFLQLCSGGETPLLRMDAGAARIKWGLAGFAEAANGTAFEPVPKAIMVGDPRYNYAPECWFRSADGNVGVDGWLSACGAHAADGDIFMQVSDQCRLQSVYELANLPRVGEDGFVTRGTEPRGALPTVTTGTRTAIADSFADALYHEFMWKTYDPFGRYRDGGDGFERLRMVSNGGGFKINPYSDSTNILMAAFANTPHDWRCASADNQEISADSASAFNAKYAWNEYSSGANLKWYDLEEVAGEFMAELRANVAGNEYEEPWEAALAGLGWQTAATASGDDGAKYLLEGLDLDGGCKVFNTDRKFLYGFWHDCFAARQQLFLVFVRAEPVMMGGGAIGQTPPQLGARAMALVWRDPRATSDPNAPHRTRILFYRQFE